MFESRYGEVDAVPVQPEEPTIAADLERLASALAPLRASNSRSGLAHAVCRLVTGTVAAGCRIDTLDEAAPGAPGALVTLSRGTRADRADLADPAHDLATDEVRGGAAAVVPDHGRGLSWVVIPLVAHRRTIGGLRVILDGVAGPSATELAFLHHIGSSLALGLSAAELHEQSERVSRRLQDSLLPNALPEGDWFKVAARYVPATAGLHVGGDWYDAQMIGADELAFSVGDVAGHGVEAAARMGELRSAITALRLLSRAPDDLISLLHRLCDPTGYFATAVCARLDPLGHFRWASAGHLPPVVAHARGGAELMAGHQSPPLGAGVAGTVVLDERALAPGDTILLYTDGLVERRDEPIDDSQSRLVAEIAELGATTVGISPEDLLDAILERREASGPTGDDIAVVAVRLVGRPG